MGGKGDKRRFIVAETCLLLEAWPRRPCEGSSGIYPAMEKPVAFIAYASAPRLMALRYISHESYVFAVCVMMYGFHGFLVYYDVMVCIYMHEHLWMEVVEFMFTLFGSYLDPRCPLRPKALGMEFPP